MTSASPCGMSHETGLARSFSDDPKSSFNKPAFPASRGIPLFDSINGADRIRADGFSPNPNDLQAPKLPDFSYSFFLQNPSSLHANKSPTSTVTYNHVPRIRKFSIARVTFSTSATYQKLCFGSR